ncbi:endonuclease/Exonuclease/phosphatase family domain-containing protein [Ditylenchus destructor]|nr:endonuclease/Exonuclease/phosphatase family domain-containing protein [Ditylenchus destructor]
MSNILPASTVITCCLCENATDSVEELIEHLSAHHIQSECAFQCEQCDSDNNLGKFTSKLELKKHMDELHGTQKFWYRSWYSPETEESEEKIRQFIGKSIQLSEHRIPLHDQYSSTSISPQISPQISRKQSNLLKICSWNVNGLESCLKKGGEEAMSIWDANIIILHETRCKETPEKLKELFGSRPNGYRIRQKINSVEAILHKKGPCPGMLTFSEDDYHYVHWEIADKECLSNCIYDDDTRYCQMKFKEFYLIAVNIPHSGSNLKNSRERQIWDDVLLEQLTILDKKKPVVLVGSMNVAHNEIDIADPIRYKNHAGFTDQERENFSRLLAAGFVDVYRALNPEKKAYTCWSYRANSRERNVGKRYDYFLVSERFLDKIVDCDIHSDAMGSTHCPISIIINMQKFDDQENLNSN